MLKSIDLLNQGIATLGINLESNQVDQLAELLSQLLKWNSTYNLTVIKDEEEALKLHLLDSLSIVPHWSFSKTLDVGTGPGFPGLPLAIALPEQTFHLLDSNSKKVRFIRQQIHHLGLTNVTAWHSRVEQHQINNDENQKYDAIVSRAFASLADMVKLSEHLLSDDGRWMAMKGAYLEDEVAELPEWVEQVGVTELVVPGLQGDRCLIELKRGNR